MLDGLYIAVGTQFFEVFCLQWFLLMYRITNFLKLIRITKFPEDNLKKVETFPSCIICKIIYNDIVDFFSDISI